MISHEREVLFRNQRSLEAKTRKPKRCWFVSLQFLIFNHKKNKGKLRSAFLKHMYSECLCPAMRET